MKLYHEIFHVNTSIFTIKEMRQDYNEEHHLFYNTENYTASIISLPVYFISILCSGLKTVEVSGTRRQRRNRLLSLHVMMIIGDINEGVSGMGQQEIETVRTWFQQKAAMITAMSMISMISSVDRIHVNIASP